MEGLADMNGSVSATEPMAETERQSEAVRAELARLKAEVAALRAEIAAAAANPLPALAS